MKYSTSDTVETKSLYDPAGHGRQFQEYPKKPVSQRHAFENSDRAEGPSVVVCLLSHWFRVEDLG